MKLYYLKGTCSMVPHTALEWIGKPYEAQGVDHAYMKSPEYLALNPQGAVPLLTDGDFVLTQNMAILYYLDQLNPEANLFGAGDAKDKAQVVRWLSFANSDLHKTFSLLFRTPSGMDEAGVTALQNNARENILRMYQQIEQHLEGREFIGAQISVADVYIYVTLRWARSMKVDVSGLPNLVAFYDRVGANAGVQAVIQAEGIPA